jgi:hypothetical protein
MKISSQRGVATCNAPCRCIAPCPNGHTVLLSRGGDVQRTLQVHRTVGLFAQQVEQAKFKTA